MAPTADHPAYSGNPFRRKTTASQPSEHDISSPSSPSQANPFPNVGLGLGLRSSIDTGPETSGDLYTTSQPIAPRPPFTTFRSSRLGSDPPGPGGDSLQARPNKIVKKVRVQSPPPSSPEDAIPVTRSDSDEYSYDDDDENNDAPSEYYTENGGRTAPLNENTAPPRVEERMDSDVPPGGPPANPFSRTLQDIEGDTRGDDGPAAATGGTKGAMDVDSFKRLLLTGNVDLQTAQHGANIVANSSPTASITPVHSTIHSTDANSVMQQPTFDKTQNTPRKSHDLAQPDSDKLSSIVPTSRWSTSARGGSMRPKPPPPSSRYGKLIKVELGAEGQKNSNSEGRNTQDMQVTAELQRADSDINKPLPPPPARSSGDTAVESHFDREAASKTPEASTEGQHILRSPHSPTTRTRSESQNSTLSRRPAVPPQAPPPRRHARSESKGVQSQSKSADDDPPRSSFESTRSRPESIRAGITSGSSAFAPAPPPPRRPNHGRSNSSFTNTNQSAPFVPPALSPVSQRLVSPPTSGRPSLDGSSTPIQVEASREAATKVAAPPPPPARNSSVRRPPSRQKSSDANSLPSAPRRSASNRDSIIAPPPPPPRQRGSSRGSIEIHTRLTPKDLTPQREINTNTAAVDKVAAAGMPLGDTTVPQGVDILADLDALQREVDALVKQAKTS